MTASDAEASKDDPHEGAPSTDPSADVAALQHEVDRLQQRVADLEQIVADYRSQMSRILASASWRATSPLRAASSRYRIARVKLARARRQRSAGGNGHYTLRTAGLFPPPSSVLPEHSPLRRTELALVAPGPRPVPARHGRSPGQARVAVVAHVHYPELWQDIADRLARMPEPYDLLVTVTEGPAESVVRSIRALVPHAHIEVVPNRGRDWAPLIRLVNAGLLSGYDAVAKVHTKKSEHRIDGDGWRQALLDGVFESPDQIRRVISALREDDRLGVVVPTGHVAGPEHWGSDQVIAEILAARIPVAFDPDLLRFPAGSMFWCRPWLLERLAHLGIGDEHFELESGQLDASTAHALERLVGVFAEVAGLDVVEAMDVPARWSTARKRRANRPPVYAFYLPQYHRTAENDEFWGEGFTDWDNVRKARPHFAGHRQPLLPDTEVGFYDLADPTVLHRQAAMAREIGIDGLVFHYYWFDGRTVLDSPLRNWLADPTLDLPLALCWANEPWTRRWDGLADDILIDQSFGPDWAARFYRDISPVLHDPRVIRMADCPLLVIYKPSDIPELAKAVNAWRSLAAAEGLRLHVAGVLPSRETRPLEYAAAQHLDSFVAFPPGSQVRLEPLSVTPLPGSSRTPTVYSLDGAFRGVFVDEHLGRPVHPGVFPGWDNTARRGADAYVFHGSGPLPFARALRDAIESCDGKDRAVFVNAWNEYAEGAVIESRTFTRP